MSAEDTLHVLLGRYMALPSWLRYAAGVCYRQLPLQVRHGSAYARYLRQAQRGSDVPASDVDARLAEALRVAIVNVPAYREFKTLLDDSRPAWQRLRTLPTADKLGIKHDPDRYIARHLPPSMRLPMFTGGSTANPMRFYLEKGKTRAREAAYMDHINAAVLNARPSEWTLSLRGRTVRSAVRADGSLLNREPIKRHILVSSDHLEKRYKDHYLRALKALRPAAIHAFPSALYPLARWLEEEDLKEFADGVRGVLLTSENVYDFQLALFKRVFHCPVVRHYGHSERVLMAVAVDGPCEDDEPPYAFLPLYGFPEILDATGQPIEEPGVLGELVGTSFDNDAMPFVRYKTGDVAMWAEPPSMHETARFRVARIEGRLQEFVVCRDQRLVSITTLGAAHFAELASVEQIQFEQQAAGLLLLKVVARTPLTNAQRLAISQAVREKTQGGVDVDVQEVDQIERTPRGKHRMLVQRLDLSGYHGAAVSPQHQDHLLNGPSAIHASVTCVS